MQWDGTPESTAAISAWLNEPLGFYAFINPVVGALWCHKSNTHVRLNVGDWVAAERDGSGFYPISKTAFEDGYE